MTCKLCNDTGIVLGEAQRVRYGRQGNRYVAVLPGEEQLIPSPCFVCEAPPQSKVMRLRRER